MEWSAISCDRARGARRRRRQARPVQGDGGGRPHDAPDLARRTGTNERYIREWLNAQAASGYAVYDKAHGTYSLTPEQGFALATESGPASVAGAFQVVQAIWQNLPRMLENFKTGNGLPWGEQHPCLFEGTERFFRSGYIANLVDA